MTEKKTKILGTGYSYNYPQFIGLNNVLHDPQSSLGDRAYPVAISLVWDSLPASIQAVLLSGSGWIVKNHIWYIPSTTKG